MGEFRMPSLGADMEAGTLVEWLKQPGDLVKRGDIIAVVDTQKGAIEVEVFEDGVLDEIVVKPGENVPVGTVLAHIRDAQAPAAAGAQPGVSPASRLRVSPAARRLAADLGVDPARIHGTGPEGAITREDVERAAGAPAPHAASVGAPAQTAHPDRTGAMRAAIAAAMARSKREIPHYYLSTTIDVSAMRAWLNGENEKRSIADRLLPAALLIKAVALALREVPELNGFWTDGAFRSGTGIHVGCAISLRGGGLVAPALHGADGLDLASLMRSLQDLVVRARAGSLRSSELTDATITVTNLGELGVDETFGIIYPPQVALVGFGRIAERPWVSDGAVTVRPLLKATLSADHRASDGHRGGIFLAAMDRLLQKPERL
jgi:pyruvate dehydrogenase E2 component (dihydrolipoamide acetyltransferase)